MIFVEPEIFYSHILICVVGQYRGSVSPLDRIVLFRCWKTDNSLICCSLCLFILNILGFSRYSYYG